MTSMSDSPRYSILSQNLPTTIAGGELSLTDAGRLGVICTCHGVRMSVAKFTQVIWTTPT